MVVLVIIIDLSGNLRRILTQTFDALSFPDS